MILRLLVILSVSVSGFTQADTFCFAQARSYYEQVYCEVKAAGKGQRLPSFNDFKRNDEIVQALLLKRPAANAGITVAMPKFGGKAPSPGKPLAAVAPAPRSPLDQCRFAVARIVCGRAQFQLTGNKGNRSLRAGALDSANIMGLPAYNGALGDQGELNRYLLRAYRIYINKMLDIGLGGATMTFGKFAFLFGDLHDKGVDFGERFETMYGFLKKDKRGIGVSESVPANVQLSIADCAPLEKHMIACVGQGRNYIYLRSDA